FLKKAVPVDGAQPSGGAGVAHGAGRNPVTFGLGEFKRLAPAGPGAVLEKHGLGLAAPLEAGPVIDREGRPQFGAHGAPAGDAEVNHDVALGNAGQAMNLANIVGLAPDDVFAVTPCDAAAVGVGRFAGGEDVEVRSDFLGTD